MRRREEEKKSKVFTRQNKIHQVLMDDTISSLKQRVKCKQILRVVVGYCFQHTILAVFCRRGGNCQRNLDKAS